MPLSLWRPCGRAMSAVILQVPLPQHLSFWKAVRIADRKKQQFGQVALNALCLVGATALMVDISLNKLLVELSDATGHWTGTFMFADLFPVN